MAEYSSQGGQNYPVRGQIVQNDDGTISIPRNVITSILSAHSIYETYRRAHLKRIALYSEIAGLFSGNTPYDPAELQAHGLGHIANFNDMSPRSRYRKASQGYWNLLYAAERVAKFTLRGNFQEAIKLANVLSDNFDKVVKSWKPFTTVFNTLIAQLVQLGVSPVFWRDERDWRWRPIEMQRFFVAPQASTNIDDIPDLCIESVFTAQYLYDAYVRFKGKEWEGPSGDPVPEDELELNNESKPLSPKSDKSKSPWNIKALEQFLIFYANQTIKSGSIVKDLVDLQQRIQEGSFVWESSFADGFRIVSLFKREYDGKISHYMFDRNYTSWQGEFLYFMDRQYTNLEQALVIFTMSPGEFTIHSNRGVGHEIFAASQAVMQVNCAIVDMSKMASTPFVKTLSVGGKEFEQIRIFPGTLTNIGSAEFVPTTFGANIQQLIGSSQFLNQLIDMNVANSGDDPGLPDKDSASISPTQAKMQSFREFGIPKNNIQHFYSFLDTVISNMAIKMLHSKQGYPGYEYAQKWKQMCIEDGVPPEIFELKGVPDTELPPHMEVKATRVAGDGSTLGTLMGLEALNPVASSFSPEGIKEYTRQYIRAVQGPEFVSAYISADPEPGEEVSLAAVENGIMKLTESPVVSPANDHQTHIVSHFALINDTIKNIEGQQTTPMDGDKIFSVAVPHVSEHIQIFSKSIFAKAFMQQMEKPWKEIQKFAHDNRIKAGKMIEAAMKQKQQDAQQQQQAMGDAQRKDFTAQADAKRADFKVQSQVQRGAEANQTRAEIMKEKVQREAENMRLKIQLESQVKQGEAQYNNPPRTQEQQLDQQPMDELRSELNTVQGNRPAAFDIEGPPS